MNHDPISLLNDIIQNYFLTHAKLKVGKINSISGSYASIEFYEQNVVGEELQAVPPLQEVPLLQTLFSSNGNAGVIVPYEVGDNVVVGILDNLNKQAFFTNNNTFKNLFPHNLANAIVLGRVDTKQQPSRTTAGVLLYKETSSVEVLKDGVKIAKGSETLAKVLEDLTTKLKGVAEAISQSTTTVESLGMPTPLDNAGVFTAFASTINDIITRINNLLK
jgi:hypothetical protein